jgi:hypothetical protein
MSKYLLISVYFLKRDMIQSRLIMCNNFVLRVLDKWKIALINICWKLDPIPVTSLVLSVKEGRK